MLFRKIEKKLEEYYSNTNSKILIINGARQIGKTYIIRETASKYFKNYIEINLKDDYDGDQVFKKVKTIDDFYMQISIKHGKKLKNISDTIIFLDEIQVYPHILSMLKPLKQDNKYRYIASGSLLGITLKHTFIPMGSIMELKMYPLDFEEFLIANHVGSDVIRYLKKCFDNKEVVSDNVHESILKLFKEYLICGGLPEAVNEFVNTKNLFNVRYIQNTTYIFYKDDASQYDQIHNLKIRTIYDYLISYMENKVKRLKLKAIEGKKKISLTKYENEFDYLISSGCCIPSKAVSNPKYPLVDSSSKNLIKLYYNDVGILSNILFKEDILSILNEDKANNLGSLYETAVAQELIAHDHNLFYFDSKKVGEVDFIINNYKDSSILPIEIKSGKNQNNFRAIPKLIKEPYNLKNGYIFSNKNYFKINDNLFNFPIYLTMFL